MEIDFRPPFVFLETASFDKDNQSSFLFTDFIEVLTFNSTGDPGRFFKKVQGFLERGFWLCGYFTYEFGYFLEPALYHLREKNKHPLAWLGVCRKPEIINRKDHRLRFRESGSRAYKVENLKANITRDAYTAQIEKIKEYLSAGLTYQVNFTFKLKFDFSGDALGLYANLKRSQPTPYLALLDTGDSQIISFSPELFFRVAGNRIITRPMKGTAARGPGQSGDSKNRWWLGRDKKIKSENVMIVDLLRSDLGKISKDVRVAELFKTEKYRTLYQLTSTIESKLRDDVTIKDVFCSLFPSGSVTGAPKIKTMELIKNLEKEPRGIYTGAIGYMKGRRACFNVAIRTIVLRGNRGEMGIGGGIVDDSCASGEFSEAMLKSKFLTKEFTNFSIIESLLWEKEIGYFLLGPHVERMRKSCAYFSIPLDTRILKARLEALEKTLLGGRFKVRVAVSLEGEINLGKELLEAIATPVKIKVSSHRIDPSDIFLYHKTSQRALYDKEKKRAEQEGFFEVIFLNKDGQVTEGAITNIFLAKQGRLYTPSVSCGLLKGVLRDHLLKENRLGEGIFYLQDLFKADKVYVGNSVRGLLEADFSCPPIWKKEEA